jgi:hypothetical protein
VKKLDLHGKRHSEVETEVVNFIFTHEPPFEIITGDSHKMRQMVLKTISKYKFKAMPKGLVNYGSFIVTNVGSYCFACECDPCDCHWGEH